MKQLNNVDSEAGTQKTKNSINVLQKISKSALTLLIAMAGFGTMSFTQDDTSVNNIDTNLNVKKEKASESNAYAYNACCGMQVVKPGDDTKNAFYISLPKQNSFAKADKETADKFIAEAKARALWSIEVAEVSVKADKEMDLNFKTSNMYPSAEVAVKSDVKMIESFTDDVVLKSMVNAGSNALKADKEMADRFMTDHFSINVKVATASIAKADAEVISGFERANFTTISLPSKLAAHGADVEMIQYYQINAKSSVETVVAK